MLSRFRRRERSSSVHAGRTRSWLSRVLAPDPGARGDSAAVAPPEQRRPQDAGSPPRREGGRPPWDEDGGGPPWDEDGGGPPWDEGSGGPPWDEDGGGPPWDEGSGRHRRSVPSGRPDIPGPARHAAPGAPVPGAPVPGGPVPGGYAPAAAGYAAPGQQAMPTPGRPLPPVPEQRDVLGPGRLDHPGPGQQDAPAPGPRDGTAGPAQPGPAQAGQARPSVVGGARARVRRRQAGPEANGSPQSGGGGVARQGTGGRAAARRHGQRSSGRRSASQRQDPAGRSRGASQGRTEAAAPRPWYELAGGWQQADGSTHCGSLEPLVRRQWDRAETAPAAALRAVERLARLPQRIKDLLTAAVDAIYIGPGGVPDLDDMSRLRGVPLPSGRATWDACAGAYGDRKIVVGTRPSPSPDVMCHEVGHAVDDSDAPPGRWQSDSAEFRMLYDQCLPSLVSHFHRQQGVLGRREFFADAFAAIASGQRPALVDMLGGKTRVALNVMLFFNRRYGI
ncbi:MAG TPA: hypothetical protein VGI37_08240 [Streptosporangiaceae bacterium]